MNTKPENWEKLTDTNYRHALAMAQFKRFVPFQISALRKERGWSQQELAERSGLTQGVISRAEDPDNGNLAANTILRIANGFDVVFVGQFMSYAEFDKWRNGLSESRIVLGFDKENKEFEKTVDSEPNKIAWQYFEDLTQYPKTMPHVATHLCLNSLPSNVTRMEEAIRKLRDKKAALGQPNLAELQTTGADVSVQNVAGGPR